MRALVIGGAGFIGSHLCDSLLGKGHYVICLDNLISGSMDNIKHNLKNAKFKFIKHDITKALNISGKIDFVYCLASPASPVTYGTYPLETMMTNSLGTYNALELSKKKNASFLLTSTSEVYGDPKISPQTEEYWGNVNSVGPRSCYDEGKRFAEALTMVYKRKYGVKVHIARIFNTYGPRMAIDDGRVIPNFICCAINGRPLTIYGKGSQTRSLCYVSDMIAGLQKLMLSKQVGPINLGNTKEMTIIEIAKLVNKLSSNQATSFIYKDLPEDDPKKRKPDISKANHLLGWSPVIDVEKGLKLTIDYFKSKVS